MRTFAGGMGGGASGPGGPGSMGGGTFGPDEVESALLPVFWKVKERHPLTSDDCVKLGRLFVYENVKHWICEHMARRKPGVAFADECPLGVCSPDGKDEPFDAPESLAPSDMQDVCRTRIAAHPWALQVAIFWNDCWRARSKGGTPRARPSQDCAWKAYESLLDSEKVRRRWDKNRTKPRPATLAGHWRQIAAAVADHMNKAGAGHPPPPGERLDHLPPELFVRLVMLYNNVLTQWTARQRHLPQVAQGQMMATVKAFLVPAYTCWKMRWPFPARLHRSETDAYVKLIRDLGIRGANAIADLLSPQEVKPLSLETVLAHMSDHVWPFLNQGLPDGHPFDDPVVQDLFWYRLNPSGGPWQFRIRDWCQARWQ